MVKLDILSDPVCPWCYIGKANLDVALNKHIDHPFDITWHPFQLNPGMPEGGMDRQEYLDKKFGGRELADSVYSRIASAAVAAGLDIDFEAIKTTPNTIDAHRLIHWADVEGRQTAVVSKLFKAYFADGRDIGDRDVLIDIAQSCNMDRTMVERLLSSDADLDDIRARDEDARKKGVTGVPTFVVEGTHILPGAQPPEAWDKLLTEFISKQETQD